jgi:hypothetical protein
MEISRTAVNQLALPYRNGMSPKRCASALSFVWEFKNIDYLNFLMSYGGYTKRSILTFFCVSEIVVCS